MTRLTDVLKNIGFFIIMTVLLIMAIFTFHKEFSVLQTNSGYVNNIKEDTIAVYLKRCQALEMTTLSLQKTIKHILFN